MYVWLDALTNYLSAAGFPDEEPTWLARNATLFVLPFLAGYFARRRQLDARQWVLAAVPFALGAEFGGGRRPRTRQFPEWRGAGLGAGYFLYPTVRSLDRWIGDTYADALDAVLAEAARRGSP